MSGMQRLLVVVAGLVLLGLFSFSAPAMMNDYFVRILTVMCINAMLVVSMGLANGFTGVFSLGHVGFVGVGAYTTAVITTKYGLSPWLGLPTSLILTAVIAIVVGLAGFLIGKSAGSGGRAGGASASL